MGSIKTTYDDPALGGKAIARDQGRELLGQVMGYVTVGFAALGEYLGRNLSGGTGLVLFIGAFGWSLTSPRRLLLGTTSDFAPTAGFARQAEAFGGTGAYHRDSARYRSTRFARKARSLRSSLTLAMADLFAVNWPRASRESLSVSQTSSRTETIRAITPSIRAENTSGCQQTRCRVAPVGVLDLSALSVDQCDD
jgi:hypothetical protein